METDKQYLSQVTKNDMKEIAEAANAYAGAGIDIQRNPDGMEISIDRSQFTRWVKVIMNGGTI